jgi:large subunit ribosomal protein L21
MAFRTYAIVEISGRQFWIQPEQYYDFNRIPTKVGEEIIFNKVLLAWDSLEDRLTLGYPYIDQKRVEIKGTILKHLRGRKTIVYKMRPKKKTRKKQGHRQDLTRVRIESININ